MTRLEHLTRGAAVRGILPNEAVTVVDVRWHGDTAVTLTYTDARGRPDQVVLYRANEPDLEVAAAGRAWTFDGDGGLLRLVSEAHRIRLAHLFDPLLAVHTSLVEPLPHQITAVYGEMLVRQPLRFLLADDPGAGNTIMGGLLIMDAAKVRAIREEMERAEARQLQPYSIASFFLEAFKQLGGTARERERGRYELTHVPAALRSRQRLDRENPNLGRYSATRRVARTLYLGSAPTLRAANKGLEDRAIKLGCVQPGETVSIFGDALRRLIGGATHLYENGQRYWFSTQPSVNRLAQDRAEQQREDVMEQEILRRLREEVGGARSTPSLRGDFAGVHLAPPSSADVSDDREARLVVLGPTTPHAPPSKQAQSAAHEAAKGILATRGSAPRRYKNMLAFLAPDTTRLDELEQAVRQYLAWKSIEDEAETLNLDAFQRRQVETRCKQADDTVKQRIPETYVWLLLPVQPPRVDGTPDPFAALEWEEIRLQGPDSIAVRASKRMRNDGQLITQYGGVPLRLELDRIPLWRVDHVALRQLADYLAEYLYLPRLRDTSMLLGAVAQGLDMLTWEDESFAYAERYDAATERYQGLLFGQARTVALDDYGVLVKPEAARRQVEADDTARRRREEHEAARRAATTYPTPEIAQRRLAEQPAARLAEETRRSTPPARRRRRYHGAVRLDTLRMTREAGQIAEAILQHLAGLPGAKVTVTWRSRLSFPTARPITSSAP